MSNVENLLWRTNVKRAHSVWQLLFVIPLRIWRSNSWYSRNNNNPRGRNLCYLEMQKILGGQHSEQVPADRREQFSDLKLTSGGEL